MYDERKKIILQQLKENSIVKVNNLSSLLNISLDTVRRDLKLLEKEGLLKCVHGGAIIQNKEQESLAYKERRIANVENKKELAKKAIKLINEGDFVCMNAGTTNVVIAKQIVKYCKNITVVTNNIEAVNILMKNKEITTYLVGGILDNEEKSTYGQQCEYELNKYYPDICFLSVNAVNKDIGYTDFRFNEISIINIMKNNSKKVFTLMDSTKIDKMSKKLVLEHKDVDAIISDNNLTLEKKQEYLNNSIEII